MAYRVFCEVSVDVGAKVSEVILADLAFEDLIDHREKVMERADGLEWRGSWRTEDAARGSQHHRVFDSSDGNAALVKNGRQEAVVVVDHAGARRLPIRVENLADVIGFGQIHDHEGFSGAFIPADREEMDL